MAHSLPSGKPIGRPGFKPADPATDTWRPVPAEVKKAMGQPVAALDSGALLAEVIQAWGGAHRIALDLYEEFQHAPKGGMARQRIMEAIQRLIITCTAQEKARVVRNEDLDDEDIDRKVDFYIAKMKPQVAAAGPVEASSSPVEATPALPAPSEAI